MARPDALFPSTAVQLRFHRATSSGSASIDLSDESAGTRELLALVSPMLDILTGGQTTRRR